MGGYCPKEHLGCVLGFSATAPQAAPLRHSKQLFPHRHDLALSRKLLLTHVQATARPGHTPAVSGRATSNEQSSRAPTQQDEHGSHSKPGTLQLPLATVLAKLSNQAERLAGWRVAMQGRSPGGRVALGTVQQVVPAPGTGHAGGAPAGAAPAWFLRVSGPATLRPQVWTPGNAPRLLMLLDCRRGIY